jgi:hypothetical protein
MLKINLPLIAARGIIVPVGGVPANAIVGDNSTFVNALLGSLGVLPTNPPFEIHPYKEMLPLRNYRNYIIGTYPPISYILDRPELSQVGIPVLQQPPGAGGFPINRPWIPFYHGNKGSMWNFLLTNIEMATLENTVNEYNPNNRINARQFLTGFLNRCKISYADIIDSTQRMLNVNSRYDASDNNLYNIGPNYDLIRHLLTNSCPNNLLFNTSSIFGNSGVQIDGAGLVNVNDNTKAFDLFVRCCHELGFIIEVQVQHGNPATQFVWTNIVDLQPHQRKNKIIFEMKIINPNPIPNMVFANFHSGASKTFTVVTPFSPAAVNRGRLMSNSIVQNYILNGGTPTQLLTLAYQCFRNNNFAPLYNINF